MSMNKRFHKGDVVAFVPPHGEGWNAHGYQRSFWAVVLYVTKAQIRRQHVNCDRPGWYGFYGLDEGGDRLNHADYAKIEYLGPNHVKVGRVGQIDWRQLQAHSI